MLHIRRGVKTVVDLRLNFGVWVLHVRTGQVAHPYGF